MVCWDNSLTKLLKLRFLRPSNVEPALYNLQQVGLTARKKRFCYTSKIICLNRDETYFVTTKCLVLLRKRLVAAAKFLVALTKSLFVVPNSAAVTKPFFPWG